MLPCENRLVQKKDFQETCQFGSFFSFGIISLKKRRNNLNKTRVGFSVGIKFSPKATERNKLKRQLRETVKERLEDIKKGFDLVIFVNSKDKKIFSEKIKSDLEAVFKKAGLI